MHDKMIDHGLDQPRLATDTGYFQVIFTGPGDDLKRLRVPAGPAGEIVPPSVQEQLTERQREMLAMLVRGEELTSKSSQRKFKVSGPAVYADFETLIRLGVARRIGAGRSTRYVLQTRSNR
jgi:ATP-dependent DNA helicase RecG